MDNRYRTVHVFFVSVIQLFSSVILTSVADPEKAYSGSRIPAHGSKRHRIRIRNTVFDDALYCKIYIWVL
jgi:hypothetical protein